MTSIAELIDAFRAGQLKLPALFDALITRGAQPDAEYRAELVLLERLRDEGSLAPDIARALSVKLTSLQVQAVPLDGDVEDATVVQPASRPSPPVDASTDADATVVQPTSRPQPRDEVTIVKPASRPSSVDAQATGTTGTQGDHTGDSLGHASWQDVASAEGGDYATVGMLLKGRFHLEREIGRGGMGVVFLARDERKVEARDRDPYVAVKVLNDEFRRHPDSLIALQRESRRSQSLAHDNIVRVYDFDKDRTIVFMTMEYIDGSDLKTLIRERAFRGLPLAEARPLINGMANALQRAHAAGVVHSDFKPGNVMVTRDGVPKVFDFGIARAAKRLGEAVGEETVFDAGTLGALTPAYASLEMTQGKKPTPGDDIYALGCVAFELLTGKHPFDKVSAEVALKEGRKPPPVPRLTRRQYKALCDCVALHAEQRLKSADALVEGLRDIGLRERVGRPAAYAMAGVLLLLATGWFVAGQLRTRQVAEVVARFQPDNPHRYADETQAFIALDHLSEDERRQLMLTHGDLVQSYLLERVDAYWQPSRGRRDYAAAQRVFALPGQLHLFLPQLDLRRTAVDKEKHDLDQPKPVARAASPSFSSTARAVATPPVSAKQPTASSPSRMQQVAAELLREGEHNYAQQKYSEAIANAKAALQIDPGNPEAKRFLYRAQQAQQRAMSSISVK